MGYKVIDNDIGVYQILNVVNGKRYIGSSSRLHGREREHFNALKRGDHPNVHLQKAFCKYGPEAFSFEVISRCSEQELAAVEQQYLDKYDKDSLYNICRQAYVPEPLSTKVAQYDLEGTLVAVWNSIRKAARAVGVDSKTIIAACDGFNYQGGKCTTAAGYQWRRVTGEVREAIEPCSPALRRKGKTWPEYWRSGEYVLYIWNTDGDLLGTSNNIFTLAADIGATVNRITRVLRGERKSIKGRVISLNTDVFPGYDVPDGYRRGVELRLDKHEQK